MSLKEAHIEEERLAVRAAQKLNSAGRYIGSRGGFRMKNFVEADGLWIGSDVLQSSQHGMISGRTQCVEYVLVVIVEAEAAMRQPEHPVAMRALAGQQRGTAG